jgi:WhiB family redox-sensing transcriptional regulator
MKPWAPRGACRSVDPDWFFGPDGERGAERAVREAVAKKICARCPVIDSCLAWAMAKNEAGYWAGTSEEERTTIRRKATRVRSKSESAS